jgi:hypothetical protein
MIPRPKGGVTMLNRVAVHFLIVALALLASSTLSPPVAAVGGTWVVDDDSSDCVDGSAPDYPTITQALGVAINGDTIRVCEGEYTEATMTINVSLTITGPGATEANDGVATVHHGGGGSAIFSIETDGVTLEGLDLDASSQTFAIVSKGDYVTIQDNEIRNATSTAIWVGRGGAFPPPSNVNILRNDLHDNSIGMACSCDDSGLWSNTVDGDDTTTIEFYGDRGTIAGNVVTNGLVIATGDDMVVNNNEMSAGDAGRALYVSGSPVTVTNNTLSDSDSEGIRVGPGSDSSTSVTIGHNTFTHINAPIHLIDSDPADAFTVTVTIGGNGRPYGQRER